MRLENRVLVSGMTILIGVMLLLVAGCGDDETNTPTTITGSMADHEFLAVKTQMDDFVDSVQHCTAAEKTYAWRDKCRAV